MGIDPQVLDELAVLRAGDADAPLPPVGDIATRRANSRRLFDRVLATRPPVEGVDAHRYHLTTEDGATLELTWYRRADSSQPGSAALYIHGGGMILGLGELGALYDSAVRGYVGASGVPLLVVDYRIAPDYPHPVPVQDCYAALVWLAGRAGDLEVDPERLAVMGDSAGGGLAAGVALMARDRDGPAVAQQLL
ncbi:MAG: alpha/beta hydrolase, partial [Mycobacterium sp.]